MSQDNSLSVWQAIAKLMSTKITEYLEQAPKWMGMPQIAEYEPNLRRASAAIAIAYATSKLTIRVSQILSADIDHVLGHPARTAYEMFIDTVWLHEKDEDGQLSQQFLTWQTTAMKFVNDEHIEEPLEKRPDRWTVLEGKTTFANPEKRRKVVAEILKKRYPAGFSTEIQMMFRRFNLLSHGVSSTISLENDAIAPLAMTGCYLTVQESIDWLTDLTGEFPDKDTEDASNDLRNFANKWLKKAG